MPRKVGSVVELAEICQSGAACSDDWAAFHRIFKVTMSSNRMVIPKPFAAKISRWFKVPTDTCEGQSFRRAENQSVGKFYERKKVCELVIRTGKNFVPSHRYGLWQLLSHISLCPPPPPPPPSSLPPCLLTPLALSGEKNFNPKELLENLHS